ncbi:MAG: DEAD/DEAH box helicase [Myxococcota bacterium]
MFNFIARLFGTQQERDIKKLKPYIQKINHLHEQLKPLSNDQLRKETDKLRTHIQQQVASIEQKISTLQAQATQTDDIKEQFNIYNDIDQLKKKHNQKTEKTLTHILPQAFAIIKETARRFAKNSTLIVTANRTDRMLAAQYDHITLEKDKAHWQNTWIVGGNQQTWGMVHYDVQLMGGIVLHQGKIAEMGTGEGKTLVATLPIFLNALTQKGVHVITINDYLAKRDAEWMAPLFQFHGISVACIENTPIQSPQRRQAYQADITYGTNSGFAFDFLYDNIAKSPYEQVQRDHFYAVIDEIDEALIDGARTPYIISGPKGINNSKVYYDLKPRVKQMYQAQQKLVVDLLKDAKEKIANNNNKEGGISLFRAHRGLPTYLPLINFLSEKGIKKILAATEDYYLAENSRRMPEADQPLFFTIDKKTNTVDITDKGIEYFTKQDDKQNFFILPNIAVDIDNIEKSNKTDQEKIDQKNALIQQYATKRAHIHATNQLLKAYTLFLKDIDYVVINRQVKLVDHKTGRILKGRRLSDGLHEAIEAKEDVRVASASQTYASITPPNLFRRYHKLSGMTGTANTEATEFLEIYKLEVVTIPPNKPVIRKDLEDRIYKTEREKFNAIKAMVQDIQTNTNRPILIITPSVQVSERIRKLLDVPPQRVLNAKNHHLEANIIADAGQPHAITVATQMAGRGTDIKVADQAEKNGGLCVIIVEKHETRRVVNQARGRAGRQGQQGSSICFLSLEDTLIVHWQQGPLGKQVDKIWHQEGEVLIDKIITNLITNVQKDKEHGHFLARKRSLEYDNVIDKQRTAIYRKRNHSLTQKRLGFDTMYSIYSTIREIIPENVAENEEHTILSLIEIGLQRAPIENIIKTSNTKTQAVKKVYQQARQQQQEKQQAIAHIAYEKFKDITDIEHAIIPIQHHNHTVELPLFIPDIIATKGHYVISALQSIITLEAIDKLWTAHLEQMDELQDSVRTASYENKDPLLVFKIEGVAIFQTMLFNLNKTITQQILAHTILEQDISVQQDAIVKKKLNQLQANKPNPDDDQSDKVVNEPTIIENNISRNQRVTVRYIDGTIKENIKYKTIAEDLDNGKCHIINNDK